MRTPALRWIEDERAAARVGCVMRVHDAGAIIFQRAPRDATFCLPRLRTSLRIADSRRAQARAIKPHHAGPTREGFAETSAPASLQVPRCGPGLALHSLVGVREASGFARGKSDNSHRAPSTMAALDIVTMFRVGGVSPQHQLLAQVADREGIADDVLLGCFLSDGWGPTPPAASLSTPRLSPGVVLEQSMRSDIPRAPSLDTGSSHGSNSLEL